MMNKYVGMAVFPVTSIKKGSNIIIYGAGRNGKVLFEQNKELGWCNVIAFVDQNVTVKDQFPVKVILPEAIREYKGRYDYILISVANENAKREIMDKLLAFGVPYENIIDELPGYYFTSENAPIIEYEKVTDREKRIQIAFRPGGVMGDHLIALRLYQEIVKLAPNSEIDILEHFHGFAESIFYGQSNLREIIYHVPCNEDREKYDLIIESHFEPSIIYCNMTRLETLAPELAWRLKILYDYQNKDLFRCSPAQYMNRIQWDRAKFKEWNCYTFLGNSGAFDIQDMKVKLYINEEYVEDYRSLRLGEVYCTFNYGASNPLGVDIPQTKVWPYEYYCELLVMLKKEFPNINLVQVGGKEMKKVPGADFYVMGQNLEIVKCVLKNALLHIDCEGGLVHIASALGTKCFVMFGPTPVGFFGYPENENIVSEKCNECCGLIPEWYNRCYKYDMPECMYSIKPDNVFTRIKHYILLKEGTYL